MARISSKVLKTIGIVSVFCTGNALAFDMSNFVQINTYGYVVNQPEPARANIYDVRHRNLERIQSNFSNERAPYSEIPLPVDRDEARDRIAGYDMSQAPANPQPINEENLQTFCNNLGFSSNFAFYNCMSEVMKTKLTEESVTKHKFNMIDTNIMNALKSKANVGNFTTYDVLVTTRNKMDCLDKPNYQKCIKAVVEYKQCYNSMVDYAKTEHDKNMIVCYVKAAIRFPNPVGTDVGVRNAYYGVCTHLIAKELKSDVFQKNKECNSILEDNEISEMAV